MSSTLRTPDLILSMGPRSPGENLNPGSECIRKLIASTKHQKLSISSKNWKGKAPNYVQPTLKNKNSDSTYYSTNKKSPSKTDRLKN